MKLIILLGAPGSGKGSISQTLVNKYGFHHLSTGEILRAHVNSLKGDERGNLVDDDCVNGLLLEALKKYEKGDLVLLDGYPRTRVQADFLAKHARVDFVFLLTNISDDAIVERLKDRVLCRERSHTFNLKYNPPKIEGVCDFDGSELYRRPDDEEEIIRKRLRIYREHTRPLVDYYRGKGECEFLEVDANGGIDEMAVQILKKVRGMG